MKWVLTCLTLLVFTVNGTSKDFVIAIEDWPPYEYVKNDTIVGFDVTIVKDVLKSMGLNAHIKVFPWVRALKYAKEGKIDAIMSLYKTKEREKFIYFPKEYLSVDQNILITFHKNRYTFDGNLKTLKNRTVIVTRGNSYGENFDNAKYISKYSVNSHSQVIGMVAKNRYPFGIVSKLPLIHLSKKLNLRDKIKILEPHVSQEALYIGFTKAKKYEKLTKEFSKALRLYKKSEKYKKLIKSYL